MVKIKKPITPNKPKKRLKPMSLHPLEFDQAMRGLLIPHPLPVESTHEKRLRQTHKSEAADEPTNDTNEIPAMKGNDPLTRRRHSTNKR